jgi:hypothetical protein
MTCRRIGLAALLATSLALPAAGGQGGVDVSKLPIDLERIQRQLRQATVREEHDGLNLRYIVDVFGQAPRIDLFPDRQTLLTGPVPYGAPTHRQMIEMITPQEFRAPAADLGGLFRWLADKSKDKARK